MYLVYFISINNNIDLLPGLFQNNTIDLLIIILTCVGLLTAWQLILQKDLNINTQLLIYIYDCHINHIYISTY